MAFIQKSAELVVGSGGLGSGDLVFPGATTAGNLVVIVCWSGNTSFSFTATGFSTDVSHTTGPNSFAVGVISRIVASGATTYTVSNPGFSAWRCIGYEFSEVAATSYVEASGNTGTDSIGGTTARASRPSGINTTVAGPMVAVYQVDRSMTFTGPTGWASGDNMTEYSGVDGYANYVVKSGTSTGEQGTVTTSSDGWISAVIVAYKATGTAPTVSAPSAATVTAPGTATFGVTITGTSTGVQWQYSTDGGSTSAGSVVGGTGATATSYTTGATAVSTGDHRNGYQYRAAVAWSGGTVNSAWAPLTVNAAGTAPAFSVQPGNQTGTVGSTATFTFTVTGSGSLTVQAKKGGTNVGSPFAVTGGVSASYTTPTLLIGDNASSWTFEATGDTSPAATSSAATLTVLQPIATTVSVPLTTDGTTPAASLTGLKWAWFDVVTPNLMTAAPTARGAAGTTDGSGVFTATITGTAKRIGDVGYLLVTNSDGTTTQGAALRAFAGPATAS